jgi:hypothetical protein
MDNDRNCDGYINVPSSPTYRSYSAQATMERIATNPADTEMLFSLLNIERENVCVCVLNTSMTQYH